MGFTLTQVPRDHNEHGSQPGAAPPGGSGQRRAAAQDSTQLHARHLAGDAAGGPPAEGHAAAVSTLPHGHTGDSGHVQCTLQGHTEKHLFEHTKHIKNYKKTK